ILDQGKISSFLLDQGLVVATFHDTGAIQRDNLVSIAHGAQPMSDDQYRSSEEKGFKVLHDLTLVSSVERAGGFIKKQILRVFVNGASDKYSLALSAAERQATCADSGV